MKKFYLLSLLVCLCSAVFGQNTVYIYASGAAGSYTSGGSDGFTRIDDDIISSAGDRGYGVFDLSGIPPGATITSCVIGYNVASVVGGGPASGCNTYAYAGDLSAITDPGILYTAMNSGTLINTGSYGTAPGNRTFTSNVTTTGFIQSHYTSGAPISICWTGGAARTYTITGESGIESTVSTHAPYLMITYTCAGLSPVAVTNISTFICPYTSFSLNGSATGAASYLWTGPAGYSTTVVNPTIADGIATSEVYTLTAYNAAGCSYSNTVLVPVHPRPYNYINVLNYTAFCFGDAAQLEAPVPFSITYNYQWYNNDTLITGATAANYAATITGDYKVVVTDMSTGCFDTTPVATHVFMLDGADVTLSPAGRFYLCPGNSTTITVNTNNVTTDINFQWQKNGVDITGANSNSYTTNTAGFYKCILYAVAPTCTATSQIDTVIVNGNPVPAISVSGAALTTAGTYTSYQWYLNTVAIPGATSSSIVPSSNGSYRVRVSDASSCSGYSAAFAYYTAGAGHLNIAGVSIWPNPAGNVLHIESPVTVKAVITGLEGRMQLEQANATDLDISRLANGVYIVTLYSADGARIAVQQVVKQ